MNIPALTDSNQRAIDALTQFSADKLDPLQYFQEYADRFGGSLADDLSYTRPLYVDFEDYNFLHDTSRLRPIYLNDYDFNLEEDRETIERLTRMEFTGNSFDTVASCTCGHLRGNYRVAMKTVCKKCGDPVEFFLDRGEDTNLWLKPPEGVLKFVNIGFFSTYFNSISVGSPKVNIPRYFLDSKYRASENKKTTTTKVIIRNMLEELQIDEVNLNTFYERCDDIMRWTLVGAGKRHFKASQGTEGVNMLEMYFDNKDLAFSDYIKVPNRYATIFERTGKEVYSYSHQPETAQLYFAIAHTAKSNSVIKLSKDELRKNVDIVGKTLVALADQYRKVNNPKALFGKPAINRKHVCSGALPFTGRSVITSQTGIIDTDQLLVPWKMCLAIMEQHILSFLYRRGHTPFKARQRINLAAYRIDPLIDEFFTDIEVNRKAIIQSGRNPSIEFLSLRAFFLKVNRDLEDESIKIPILATASQNADFDGDNEYIVLLVDNESKAKAYGGFGHHQSLDRNIPFKVGGYSGQAATNLMNLNTMMQQVEIVR